MRAEEQFLNKVPQITLTFWLAKLVTTGMGESWSDLFAHTLGPVADLLIGLLMFGGFLWWQLRLKSYRALNYWLTLVGLAVFGTFVADATRGIGVPYLAELIIYGGAMAGCFYFWQHIEHTVSIHQITSHRKELFYWATVFCSFTLGTAVGDFMAHVMNLGTLDAGLYLTAGFVVVIILRRYLVRAEVITFWLAYILTRPIGASFADYFGYTWQHGMIGLPLMSLIWLVLLIPFLVYFVWNEHLSNRMR